MKNIFLIALLFLSVNLSAQTFRVVNMIPNTLSNETNQDSEPHIAVNPNDPTEVIGTAFTPNPTGAAATAPIYISQNTGNTWVLNNIVPSSNGMTGDITVGLSRNNILYSGILFGGAGLQMDILRSNNYLNPVTMTTLLSRNNVDQPYIEAITPLGGSQRNNDHIYVGNNDFGTGSTQTASIEQSLNAATAPAPANLTTERLEVRVPVGQDGPPIRTSTHPSGVVYAIFYRRTATSGSTRTGDIIVVRDDDWGQGATSYNDLTDPSDGLAGRIVATGINWTWNSGISGMGQVRIGDRASIAVDPRDDQTVYIAYLDRAGATINSSRLNVRRSTDGGANWSANLLTINNGIVPQLAVNIRGDVGFLCQQLIGANWVTNFNQSVDGGTTWTNTVLHTAPSATPAATFAPYLGDYAGLQAVGKDFYGIFSGNNTPNNANFPVGVTYQRNADFGTNNLRNTTNTANIGVSIDPFFFEVEQIPDDEDFYVRDWTDSPTVNDIGQEPSTDPVFYRDSDVWNRRTNSPGSFTALDRPQSEDPQLATLGNNFAFARVHRKGTGSSETVNLHFLKAEFGTGSNYVDAGVAADPTLTFSTTDQDQTMVAGYEWTLNATTSTHTCMAVEISTPNDPVVVPTLLGRAPGWPDTDLSVLYDNNKAQRNMGVHTTSSSSGDDGKIWYYAVIHNPALFTRDFELEYTPSRTFQKTVGKVVVDFPTQGDNENYVKGNQIVLKNMKPGENRWIGLQVSTDKIKGKNPAYVEFTEMRGNIPVNGFVLQIEKGSDKKALTESVYLSGANYLRIAKLFDQGWASEESNRITELLSSNKLGVDLFQEYLQSQLKSYDRLTSVKGLSNYFKNDIFDVRQNIASFQKIASNRRATIGSKINAHARLNQKIDAMLTYVDKQNGDVADIIQNLRWENEIIKGNKKLKKNRKLRKIVNTNEEYIKALQMGKAKFSQYKKMLASNVELYKSIADNHSKFGKNKLGSFIKYLSQRGNDPQRTQKMHYNFLSQLAG